MLVEHRIDHMHERFVSREKSVTAREHIPFKPTFQRVLAEHLHHASVNTKLAAVQVLGLEFRQPRLP